MSLIFCDGFDDGLTSTKWNLAYNTTILTGGRNGNRARMTDGNANMLKRKFSSADEHATIIVGFAFYGDDISAFDHFQNSPVGHLILGSDSGATDHLMILLAGGDANTSPRIEVWRGPVGSGTLLSSVAVAPWVALQWYNIEVKATLSATVGAVTTKLNGAVVNTISGVNTKNGGTKTVFDCFTIRNARTWSNGGGTCYYDDLYVCNGAGSVNNDFLGDIAVETLLPSGDGSSSQWVGSDGDSVNNSLLVDEAVPDTADYVQSNVSGNEDLYAYTDLARAAGTVFGVIANAYAHSSDSGAVSLKNVVKSGATVSPGAAQPLVTTYLPKPTVYETDPATSTAWTVAGVNAIQVGVQVV